MCLPEQSPRDVALAELARLDPAVLDAAALMGQIADLAGFISQAQGHLTRLAASPGYDGWGGRGRAQVRVGVLADPVRPGSGRGPRRWWPPRRGLREMEATGKALHAGVISFDQAQIIVQAAAGLGEAAGVAEQVLLDHAPGLDTARLRQFADEVAYRADPGGVEEREKKRWDKRHLSFGLTLDSTGVLSGSCGDAVSYEIVRTAAEAFSPPAGPLDTRTAAQRRMDGLVAACKAALDGGSAPGRHGSAPHISILVKDETLAQAAAHAAAAQGAGATPGYAASAGQAAAADSAARPRDRAGLPGRGRCNRPGRSCRPGRGTGPLAGAPPGQTGHGTLLTARQILALCCGAEVGAIRWHDGLPLDVGRTARTEPPGLRRALEARDRGCRWTQCGALAAWATAHHINPGVGWRDQPGRPGPVLPPAPPLLHPHPRLDHHRRPQRHPALHPPRRLAHPRQPTPRTLMGSETPGWLVYGTLVTHRGLDCRRAASAGCSFRGLFRWSSREIRCVLPRTRPTGPVACPAIS